MWSNPQFPAYLDTFFEEILNGKLRFLSSEDPGSQHFQEPYFGNGKVNTVAQISFRFSLE